MNVLTVRMTEVEERQDCLEDKVSEDHLAAATEQPAAKDPAAKDS